MRAVTRREWLGLVTVAGAYAQGVASADKKPTPRSKPSGLPFNAWFTDVAAQAGLRAPVVYGRADRKDYIIEVVGCGVAFFDYDNDGWLDILLLSGSQLEGAPAGATNRLYKNKRDGTFMDVTKQAGLERMGWASSVTIGDYDNDGFEDVFITYWGSNVLYHNNGDGTFTDVTERAGLLQQGPSLWNSGATWIDYDRDGRLDLFIATYLDFDPAKIPRPGSTSNCRYMDVPVNCGPRGLRPTSHKFYRNNGDGTFSDVSQASGIAKLGGSFAMTAVAGDYDEDGWPDIFVACDSTPSFLLMNQHDGTFREEALERGVALSQDGQEQAGMGVAVGDFNLDSHSDIFVTHFMKDTPGLYENDGKGVFNEVSLRSGLGVETRYVGWGAAAEDFDNDGWPDFFSVTGSIYPEVEARFPAWPYRTPRLMYRNLRNGKFELMDDVGPGVAAFHSSRGSAVGDFDNDGDLDILIMNMGEPPSLLRNDLKLNQNWLKVKLVGTKSNRSAIGSRVIVEYGSRKQTKEVAAQSSFYSVNDRRLHFGLGASGSATVTVFWTNGGVEVMEDVTSNQLIEVKEGAGIVRRERWKTAERVS
ncbi:MAG: CRTAC1 family protein [Acidobacteriaceae bacterium]|nr:CRTAC1 family protein [Acidobacteriaceae bacterium]